MPNGSSSPSSPPPPPGTGLAPAEGSRFFGGAPPAAAGAGAGADTSASKALAVPKYASTRSPSQPSVSMASRQSQPEGFTPGLSTGSSCTVQPCVSRSSAPMPSIAFMPGCASKAMYGWRSFRASRSSSVVQAFSSSRGGFSRRESQSGHMITVHPASHSHIAFCHAFDPPGQLATQYTPGAIASSRACRQSALRSPSTSTTVRPLGNWPPGKYSGRGSAQNRHFQVSVPSIRLRA
ncbi:hypothetical protein D3C71_1296670 [compost metagenome]